MAWLEMAMGLSPGFPVTWEEGVVRVRDGNCVDSEAFTSRRRTVKKAGSGLDELM